MLTRGRPAAVRCEVAERRKSAAYIGSVIMHFSAFSFHDPEENSGCVLFHPV